MRSILPAQALTRYARRLLLSGIVVLLTGLVIGALGLLMIVIPFAIGPVYHLIRLAFLVVGLVVALVGGGMILRGLTTPKDNLAARVTADTLARSLDDRYTFIRNLSRRGLGYIDAVLTGPNGALVFYFVDQPGVFFCEHDVWLKQKGARMLPIRLNPTREVVKDVAALRNYLAELKLGDIPVFAIVVFVS